MLAYLSQNADKRIFDALRQEGFKAIPLAAFDVLEAPVDTHADMLLLSVGDLVFVHKDYKIDLSALENVIQIDEPMGAKYPSDVLLNIAIVGKNVFANTKNASKTVLEYLEKQGFCIHHVAQGYAHCSTCIVGENAIISADRGIIEAAQKANVDALQIDEGYICLPPYNHGFIGGSCGSYKDKIYFCGSLDSHPNGNEIRNFCLKHGKKVIELCNTPLIDIGGILFK